MRSIFIQNRKLNNNLLFPTKFLSAISSIDSIESSELFREKLNLIYDSKCILCQKEITFLQKRDINNQIKFTDIESIDYNPKDKKNGYIDYNQGMEIIHAVKSDGTIIKGVEVFQTAYSLVNLGWLWSIYSLPFARILMDKTYLFWAKYRTYLTRNGKSIETLSSEREHRMKQQQQRNSNYNSNHDSSEDCNSYKNTFK